MKKHLIVMAVVLIAFTSAFGQGSDVLKLKDKLSGKTATKVIAFEIR